MEKPQQIIVIDDDSTTNLLCELMLRRALGKEAAIRTFTLADTGIDYIKAEKRDGDFKTVIFLDINMPVTTGWEALDLLEALDATIKKPLTTIMLSSSIDPEDKKRALAHTMVFDFIEKPLTVEKIEHIFGI